MDIPHDLRLAKPSHDEFENTEYLKCVSEPLWIQESGDRVRLVICYFVGLTSLFNIGGYISDGAILTCLCAATHEP